MDASPQAGDSATAAIEGIPPFAMRFVPPTNDSGFLRDAGSVNLSTITGGFWIGETPVTKELFEAVYETGHDNQFAGAVEGEPGTPEALPAEQVPWYAAIAFCVKLSLREGLSPAYSVLSHGVPMKAVNWEKQSFSYISQTGDSDWELSIVPGADGYRLPTEMEWMWAAMGAVKGGESVAINGSKKRCAGGSADMPKSDVVKYAWMGVPGKGGAGGKTHRVGLKAPNELGLLDMSGNVWEWCWDGYADFPAGRLTDYAGAQSAYRVAKGGAWNSEAPACSIASRFKLIPSTQGGALGFRIVRGL